MSLEQGGVVQAGFIQNRRMMVVQIKTFLRRSRGPMGLMVSAALVSCLLGASSPTAAQDLSRLQSLLSATPEGGWVSVSTGSFSAAWPTGPDSVGTVYPTQNGPGAIAYAWSSFAWDSNRGQMMLWGGGHANYAGNEMYAWKANTGTWERQSLPSRLTPTTLGNGAFYVVDNAAPLSAHTYDGNVFLPVNNMFANFLGPSYNSGDRGKVWINGAEQKSGPWLFDTTKADGNKVGGTNGSGFDPTDPGGNMWINRYGQWTGTEGAYSPYVSTDYRNEGGKDVVYLTVDVGASRAADVYRYTFGDVRTGGLDKWEKIGIGDPATLGYIRGGTGTLDTNHNLIVRIGYTPGNVDLLVWDLATASPTNLNKAVQLVKSDGSPFVMNEDMSIEYDSANDKLVIWDGKARGKVFSTQALYLGNGQLAPSWVVTELASTTTAQPQGNFIAGVYGKWKYIPELGAFMALDEFDRTTFDAPVWLYKPFATAVPEIHPAAMLLIGLGFMGWAAKRRKVTLVAKSRR
jgi:hypothetical protein